VLRLQFAFTAALAAVGVLSAEERKGEGPWTANLGPLTVRPFGFLDLIETTRSGTMVESVRTPLGSVPLGPTPTQSLISPRHSRLMMKSDLPLGKVDFKVYLESDFMNPIAGQSPYRWRQYWGQMKIGKWEVLGGQAWSLLRPNRRGIASDTDVMNTDVVEPAYHVGLMGFRYRQIRVTRSFANGFTAAIAWEGIGNTVAKVVQDRGKLHWEVQGLHGIHGRQGAGVSAVYSATKRVRLVTQEFWSRHAISEALGVVPVGTNGISMIQGVETQVTRTLEVYGYGGVVDASRSSGNHRVGEWSVGFNQTLTPPMARSKVKLNVEFSHLNRRLWDNRAGQLNFVMVGLRYSLN
jgi:hypothetical protein